MLWQSRDFQTAVSEPNHTVVGKLSESKNRYMIKQAMCTNSAKLIRVRMYNFYLGDWNQTGEIKSLSFS